MPNRGWKIAGGAGLAILLFVVLDGWLAFLLVAALVAVPVAGYFMLDPAQRRRIARIRRRRKEIGR